MSKNQVHLTFAAVAALIAFPLEASAQEVKRGGENLLHRSPVEYPADAIENNIEGTVVLEARLDGKGVVRDARVISGPDELRAAAIKSVLDWHYSTEKGAPPIVEIAIDFKLPKSRMVPAPPPIKTATIESISFQGVSPEMKEKVLKEIGVKEGDSISGESQPRIAQAVHRVDEHLRIAFFPSQKGTRIHVLMPAVTIGGRSSLADRPAVPGQITVGGNVQQAKLIQQSRPVYPPLAKQARIQGTVRMLIVIAKDGTVKNMELESGHPLLVPSALEAVRQWVYQPTLLNGEPVEVLTTVDVNYTLSQ